MAAAEFAVLLLLGSARRIFINDWKSQKRMYKWELGSELAGKTLGIVGVDAVAERIIRIAKPFGVRIFICNEPPARVEEAERKSLGEILCHSDLIILNLLNNEENKGFLSKEKINCLKQGAVVVNLTEQAIVDEKAMVEALKSKRIDQYVFETDKIKPSPLDKIENAVAFKKLSGYTKESADRSRSAWVKNISDMAGHPTS